ncbi:MAG: PKD domain-containing protein, partial [Bacteroidota bacterium]
EVGGAPLTIQFSAAESKDYDKDELTYEWMFEEDEVQSTEVNPSFTFDKIGIYDVKLKVTDPAGESVTANKKIMVGNEPPRLEITIDTRDSTFRKTKSVNYRINVVDREDGSTQNNSIDPRKVRVTMSYIPEGEDMILATIGHQQNTVPKGLELINGSDCKACHAEKVKVNGPSYEEIAKRYSSQDEDYLVSRIKKGSSGVWGETLMSAHPQLPIEDVQAMVKYILSLDPYEQRNEKILPLAGTLKFKEHDAKDYSGKYVLMASYLDNGNAEQKGFELSANEKVIFTTPRLEAEHADERSDGLGVWDTQGSTVVGSIAHNDYLKFENQDLNNIKKIKLAAKFNGNYDYRGKVEIREGNANGNKIGETQLGYFNKDKPGKKVYDISIQPTVGEGDLYLVFKNQKDEKQFVLNADWILLDRS